MITKKENLKNAVYMTAFDEKGNTVSSHQKHDEGFPHMYEEHGAIQVPYYMGDYKRLIADGYNIGAIKLG